MHVILLDIANFANIGEGKSILKVTKPWERVHTASRRTPVIALCSHAAKAVLKLHARMRGDWLPETVKQLRLIPIHTFAGIAASAFACK
jgi:hypothetical protein